MPEMTHDKNDSFSRLPYNNFRYKIHETNLIASAASSCFCIFADCSANQGFPPGPHRTQKLSGVLFTFLQQPQNFSRTARNIYSFPAIVMQQTEPAPELPQEVTHIPLWVKAIVVICAVLCLAQIPAFLKTFPDALQKSRAEKAYEKGQYAQAVNGYEYLHAHYPSDTAFTRRLGLSYYRAGSYLESIRTFRLLEDVPMPERDVKEINAALTDMAEKLHIQKEK